MWRPQEFHEALSKHIKMADPTGERIKWQGTKFYTPEEMVRLEPGVYEICQHRTYWYIPPSGAGVAQQIFMYRLDRLPVSAANRVLDSANIERV